MKELNIRYFASFQLNLYLCVIYANCAQKLRKNRCLFFIDSLAFHYQVVSLKNCEFNALLPGNHVGKRYINVWNATVMQ